MEKFTLDNDITVFCVQAKTFPEGISEAFQTLQQLHPSIVGRDCYGISYQNEKGEIIYKAAVPETFSGEAEKLGCETFIIRKGEYVTETLHDYMNNLEAFGTIFHRLLTHPDFDRNSACVEWYKNDNEVLCMVRLETARNGF